MDVSEVIRQRRQELGLTQADLAKASGMDARQIRRYEAGDVQPSLPAAKALADALQISLDELAGGLPLEGMTGPWWLAWKELWQELPIITQVEIERADADYEAHVDAERTTGLSPGWRMTFKRYRDTGLVGWFVDGKTIGVAALEPMSPGWAGRWIGVPSMDRPPAGHVALSRTREDLEALLKASIDRPRH